MRRVTQSEFVMHAVARAAKDYPSFQMAWDQGVVWQLQRASLEDAAEIPGTDPPVYVLETNVWRAAGLPIIRLAYVVTVDGVDIIRLALISN